MTTLLYHLDSYLKSTEAAVTARDGDRISLDKTIFYAQSGGQPADHGLVMWLDGQARVVDVRRQGADVWHQIEGSPLDELEAGTRVQCLLDWERRYALMRTHTALHVLCGVIWRDFGAPVTGGSMEPGSARMDFELERMSAGFAAQIEERVNTEIAANHDVFARILPRAEAFAIPDLIRTKINLLPEGIQQVRVVEIVGLDLQADGGTHVAHTSEIGHIRVTGHESKGRLNKRLRIAIEP